MKIAIKRSISIILIFLLATSIINIPGVSMAANKSTIEIIVKGKHLRMGKQPIIKESTTYIHVRDFAKALDLKVDWIGEEKTVKLSDSNTTILIPIEQKTISINGKKVVLAKKNFIEKGTTYIPLRSLAEALSHRVQWDGKNNIAIVGKFTDLEYLEDTILYTNEEHKYTMNFPKSWEKEAVLETKDGILRVYDKASYDKFKEKGFKNFGPVFEIRVGKSPIFISVPYEDVLLSYKDGKYIETYFGEDFQYFPDTVESYRKIYEEAKKSLGSFKLIDIKDEDIKDSATEDMGSENYAYEGLNLEITNVQTVKVEDMLDDGGRPWQYKILKCLPGASVSVIKADMNDTGVGDGIKPYAKWGIKSSSVEPIKIVDDMKPFLVTGDTLGIYNLESSLYVLKFEIANEAIEEINIKN